MHLTCNRNRRVRGRADRRGTTTVEFALTAPILFLILFATLEFSRYNMLSQTATNAAFEAARSCVIPGATAAMGQNAGQNYLSAARVSGGSVSINPSTIVNTTAQVGVTITVPVSQNLWAAPFFCPSGTLSKSCTLTRDWVDSTHSAH